MAVIVGERSSGASAPEQEAGPTNRDSPDSSAACAPLQDGGRVAHTITL